MALCERPSIPKPPPPPPSPGAGREIVAVRRATKAGPVVIGAITGRPASTVGKVLRRWGCSRLPRPERDPVRRYERERPGELIHVDTKKLGRFHVVGKRILQDGVQRNRRAGWQHLHVAIDDHSRLAYTEVLAGQDRDACAAFLRRAVAWYERHGITVQRVLSDNAKAYHSHRWRDTCLELGVARRYTRPYTPRTNGKAEALIKTLLREWAYRHAYPSSHHRTHDSATRAGITDTDHTAPSAASHRSAASHTSVVSTARRSLTVPSRTRRSPSGVRSTIAAADSAIRPSASHCFSTLNAS